jgi:hypothetical protein
VATLRGGLAHDVSILPGIGRHLGSQPRANTSMTIMRPPQRGQGPVARSGPEVADVFRRYGEAYRERHGASLCTAQRRVMSAIELCRTAALGGHIEQCDRCDHQRICYNSCRDRHCPKCQSLARTQWLDDRRSELLDTQYFHVIFTVPQPIATIALQK